MIVVLQFSCNFDVVVGGFKTAFTKMARNPHLEGDVSQALCNTV